MEVTLVTLLELCVITKRLPEEIVTLDISSPMSLNSQLEPTVESDTVKPFLVTAIVLPVRIFTGDSLLDIEFRVRMPAPS